MKIESDLLLPDAIFRVAGCGGKDDTEDGSDKAGDAVEIMDAASVVDLELLLQPGSEVVVADNGDHAGQGTDDHGSERLDKQVGHGPNGDAAGQSRVLDVLL